MQVEKAFEYLTTYGMRRSDPSKPPPENNMRILVECGGRGLKGIYLRNWKAEKAVDIPITVEPVQFNEARAGGLGCRMGWGVATGVGGLDGEDNDVVEVGI